MALTRRLHIWDTCSYVRRFAEPRIDAAIADEIRRRRFLFCSVVAMELYAGTRSSETKRALDDLVRHLAALDLVVHPTFEDFQKVGTVLGRHRRARGAIDPRAHFRDALMVACAARSGAGIVTENVRDFSRWSRWMGLDAARVVRPS